VRIAPRCEVCPHEPAWSFSWFADRARWYAPRSGTWKFTGKCTSETEQYYVLFRDGGRGIFDSIAARNDWIDHLREKIWFDPADFFAALGRFAFALEVASEDPTPRVRRSKGRQAQRLRANLKPTPKACELPRLDGEALTQ